MRKLNGSIISPYIELGAYEALWATMPSPSFRKIAKALYGYGEKPSFYIETGDIKKRMADEYAEYVWGQITSFMPKAPTGIVPRGSADYPETLLDAEYPVEMLYYKGDISLLNYPKRVAVVGSRKATHEGLKDARRIAHCLVNNKIAIVSGLAKGIDMAAHTTAMHFKGATIAVIGTPLNSVYPKENTQVQEMIAMRHLLLSQVPVKKYEAQNYKLNRFFFPERNITMSAISDATVIVEASDTSGTLIQAREALKQGRKLFILDRCFENKGLRWPQHYIEKGAKRVSMEDLDNTLLLPLNENA
jgi:DNA processing protein